MNKILIDSDVLDQALKALGVGLIMSEPYSKEDTFSTSIFSDSIAKISTAIKEAEQKRFSVLEWKEATEKPELGKSILVRYRSGNIYIDPAPIDEEGNFIPESPEGESMDDVIEWAYLPED